LTVRPLVWEVHRIVSDEREIHLDARAKISGDALEVTVKQAAEQPQRTELEGGSLLAARLIAWAGLLGVAIGVLIWRGASVGVIVVAGVVILAAAIATIVLGD
jgi:hypothetical protein